MARYIWTILLSALFCGHVAFGEVASPRRADPVRSFSTSSTNSASAGKPAPYQPVANASANMSSIGVMNFISRQMLKVNPNHKAARRFLGFVRIDGKWRTFSDAESSIRSKLSSPALPPRLGKDIFRLEQISNTPRKSATVMELRGYFQIRTGDFSAARETFSILCQSAGTSEQLRFLSIRDILAKNPDGMYILKNRFPAHSVLFEGEPHLSEGPVSLAHPLGVRAALRDMSASKISAGEKAMKKARRMKRMKRKPSAEEEYRKAEAFFAHAEALSPGIAKGYLIDAARGIIEESQIGVAKRTKKFINTLSQLGKKKLSHADYQNALKGLMSSLAEIDDSFRMIFFKANEHPNYFQRCLRSTEADLNRIKQMRETLEDEINAN